MADIKIIVDTTSLVDAKKKLTAFQDQMGKNQSILGLTRALGSVENSVQELIRAQDKGRLSQRSFQQGLLEQRKALEAMGLSSYMARKRVEELAQAMRSQQAAAQVDAATRSYQQLLASINPTIAAQQRLKQAHDTVRAALAAGIITRHEAAQTLLQYRNAARAAAAANQQAALGMNRFGVLTQQAGYQVGDFIVQVQSGTNVMVALGQQATQLIGTFAMLARTTQMIALFSALGVVVPLITAFGAAWMRSKAAMEEAAKSAGDLEGKIKSLDQSLKAFRRTQESIASGLSEDFLTGVEGLDQAVLDVLEAEVTLQAVRERIAKPGFGFRDMLPFLGLYLDTKDLNNAEKALAAAEQKRADAIKRLQQIRENDRIKSEQKVAEQTKDYILEMADVFRDAQQKMREENGKTLQEIDAGYKAVAASQTTLNSETEDYIKKMSDLFTKSQGLRKEVGDAAFEVLRLSGIDLSSNINSAVLSAAKLAAELNISLTDAYKLQNADVSKGVMAAAAAAKELARDLGISLRSAMAMAGMISSRRTEDVFDPRDPRSQSQDFTKERLRRMMESGELYNDFPKDESKGRAGRSQSRLEQFMNSLMTEQEQVQEWRNTQLELLQEFNDTELALIGGHAEAKFRIEKEYEDRVRALKVNKTQQTTSAISGILTGFAGLMDANNKKQFEAQKKFQIAAAVVDGYSAAVSAWDKGMKLGGPGLAAAFTAGSLLKTGGLIKQINSAQYGGGAGGGAVSGSSAAIPTSSAPQAQRVIVEGLDRNSLYTGEQLSNIFEALYKENKDRGFVFEVAR